MPRFFTSAVQFDEAASVGSAVIDGEDGRHIARSLRMHTGDALTLSDGAGTDYTGEIESITGDTVMVRLTDKFKNRSEPTLRVTLYPGMPKADKLELITQKAVELGVSRIVIVLSIRSTAKLPEDRRDRRLTRWADIMHAACEQCGRNSIPTLEFMQFEKAMENVKSDRRYMLALSSTVAPRLTRISSVAFAVGPEGGFSANEIAIAAKFGWESVLIGPRVLRTETAGLVAATLANAASGDMKFY